MPIKPEARTQATVTIPAGQAVSNSVDLTTGTLSVVISPPGWTPANLSFLISTDNVTFANLFDADGREVIKPIGPGRAVIIDPSLTTGAMYVKFRSGPSANPVTQTADRVFSLIIV